MIDVRKENGSTRGTAQNGLVDRLEERHKKACIFESQIDMHL